MHEASAAEAIVNLVSAEAEARPLPDGRVPRVERIDLVVGTAGGYMKESLEFYLGELARGTPVEGAALGIRYVKPLLRCSSCGAEFERRPFSFACPSCGGQGLPTEVGSEFYVDSIELSEE